MRMPAPLLFAPYATALAAAQVLPWRLAMLGLMAFDPTSPRQREARRMVTEKPVAALSGLMESQAVLARAWLDLWMAAQGWASLSLLPIRLAQAAAAPGQRAVRANARRLARRKRL